MFSRLKNFITSLRWVSVPFVQQTDASECGAACLTMVLRHNGKHIFLRDVRQRLESGRDGNNALAILKAADSFGLEGYGVRVEREQLQYLEQGAILHWNHNHFVVLDRILDNAVEINDPALGRRRLPLETFWKSFSSVAITLTPGEHFQIKKAHRKQAFDLLFGFLLQHKSILIHILLASIALQGFALLFPLMMKLIVDRAVPARNFDLLSVLLFAGIILTSFQALVAYIRAHLLLGLGARLDMVHTRKFMEHLLHLPFNFFLNKESGDLMMRINSNTVIREIITNSILSSVLDCSLIFVMFTALFILNYQVALLVLLMGLIQLTIILSRRKRLHEIFLRDVEAQSFAQGFQAQMLAGIETIKSGGHEHHSLGRWTTLYADALNTGLARGRSVANAELLDGFLRGCISISVIYLASHQLFNDKISLGSLLAVCAVAAGFMAPIAGLVGTINRLLMIESHIERVNDVLEHPIEQIEQRPVSSLISRLSGAIELKNVTFRYGQGHEILRDVSVKITQGQTVGIIGHTGSGKTTIIKVLLALFQPTNGQVLYDDLPLSRFDISVVRQQIGVVTQSPYLFGSTIRQNICVFEKDIPEQEMIWAARLAQIHDEIAELPLGYDTPVGEGGSLLSAGQRQRIAIARALVKRPSILFLDEATSHLDIQTEQRLLNALDEVPATKIVVAHRPTAIQHADTVLMLTDGNLIDIKMNHNGNGYVESDSGTFYRPSDRNIA